MAWHVALFSRAAKLPTLDPLLKALRTKTTKAEAVAKKPQTWQEQKAIMGAIRGLAAKAPPARPRPKAKPKGR